MTETLRVVDDDGNIIKTGDPDTDAVSGIFKTVYEKTVSFTESFPGGRSL